MCCKVRTIKCQNLNGAKFSIQAGRLAVYCFFFFHSFIGNSGEEAPFCCNIGDKPAFFYYLRDEAPFY